MKTRFLTVAFFCALLLMPVSALAKDAWVSVKTKNFNLIGNAAEKDVRAVAGRLEQIRETFGQLFPGVVLKNSIPTNVIVFKNGSSYNPFRPKLSNGKPNTDTTGDFERDDEVNYITVVADAQKDTYENIIHTYIHSVMDTNFGRTNVPAWLTEGLAEYYQTLIVKDKVTLGTVPEYERAVLQSNRLQPLKQFLAIDSFELSKLNRHPGNMYYSQAWALMHFLMHEKNGANRANIAKFVDLTAKRTPAEQAFKQAFGYDYVAAEIALQKYVTQNTYQTATAPANARMAEAASAPLSEADATAYLGDLLYRNDQIPEAEKYLQTALAMDPNSSLANSFMGLVRIKQNRYADAINFAERAVASGKENYFAYYNYAYVMSRENTDEFNFVSKFPAEKANSMRAALKKAVELNPDFAEGYRMISFINLVNNENVDEAFAFTTKGMALQPGNQEFKLLLAQIYGEQDKFREGNELAQSIIDSPEDMDIRNRANYVLSTIKQMETYRGRNAENQKRKEEFIAGPSLGNRPPMTIREQVVPPEEIARLQKEHANIAINKLLEEPKDGEKQAVGRFQRVACAKGEVVYTFKTDTETLTFASKDFSGLNLLALTPAAEELSFGCEVKAQGILTVINFRPAKTAGGRGALSAIAFVPDTFKLFSAEEIAQAEKVTTVEREYQALPPQIIMGNTAADRAKIIADLEKKAAEEGARQQADFDTQRRDQMMEQVKNQLRKVQADEKRVMGTVDKIECSNGKIIFHIKTNAGLMKFRTANFSDLKLMNFSREYGGFQIACATAIPPAPTVITFVPDPNAKAKENGILVAVEFVPRNFTIE